MGLLAPPTMSCISQPVDGPRSEERLLALAFSPPLSSISAEGLTTTNTLRRRAHLSGHLLALLAVNTLATGETRSD